MQLQPGFKILFFIVFSFVFITLSLPPEGLAAKNWTSVAQMIGKKDSVLVADPHGRVIFSKNEDQSLIPASTLKLLTSLVALHYLGPNHRFITEFYLDNHSNLKIKGYGDPLLVSEVISEITLRLKNSSGLNSAQINDLVLDDSFFEKPIRIPGITAQSAQPYDAPNGALCANFNTVSFKTDAHCANLISDEEQTPLLPFVISRIKACGLDEGRIILSDLKNEHTLYAGHLFRYFLERQGIATGGRIRLGRVEPDTDRLIFRYISRFSLPEVISRLLTFSNNFMANQLLISAGAKAFGSPGTLEKGLRAASIYTRSNLQPGDISIVEGAGLSRKNRATAKMMHNVLEKFEPYHQLMRHNGLEYYKTGTLNGIRTRAGYFENVKGERYRYVVMVNTPRKSAEKIVEQVMKTCAGGRNAAGLVISQ